MLRYRPGRRETCLTMAGLLTGALTGCAVGGEPGADRLSKERVTLRLTWWGADARHQQTIKAVRLFEKKYPHISVKTEFADWTGYWDRLATSAAGGNAPDVIQMDQLYLASYAARGGLLDLGKSRYLRRDLYEKEILDTGRYDGKLYAAPAAVTALAFLVNTTVLKELGLRLPDTASWDWNDLERLGAEVYKASDGKVSGAIPMGGSGTPQLYARQYGENLFTADGKIDVSPGTLAAYWQQARDWSRSGVAPSAGTLVESEVLPLDQTPLPNGKIVTAPGWCNQLTAYAAAAGGKSKFTLVDPPVRKGSPRGYQYLKSSMYWSVSSQCQHPAEAALLINFLTGDGGQGAKALGAERGIPATNRSREAIRDILTPEDRLAMEYVEKLEKGKAGDPPPLAPNGASSVEDVVARYAEEVLFGRLQPRAAATQFIDEMDGLIKSAQ